MWFLSSGRNAIVVACLAIVVVSVCSAPAVNGAFVPTLPAVVFGRTLRCDDDGRTALFSTPQRKVSIWRQFFSFQTRTDAKNQTLPTRSEEDSYDDRLREAAKDSASFERFVLYAKKKDAASPQQQSAAEQKERSTGYKRIEEWDEEMKNKNPASMTWDERVQFEGLRQGDRLKQNDILRKNLHGH